MARRRDPAALQDMLIVAYYDLGALILVNIIWFVLTLPLITAVPALGGLYYATNCMAHHKSADWRTFFEGFRTHFWLSWRWGVMNGIVLAALGGSLWFYSGVETVWAGWLQLALLATLSLWALLQAFTFPLLLEQKDRRLRVALRNSLVMLLRRPLHTVATGAGIVALILLSAGVFRPAWIFLTGSLCAYLANRAVVDATRRFAADPPSG